MASKAGKWAIGCGIGCAVLILIMVAVGYGGFRLVKKTVEEAQQIGDVMDELSEQYGRVREYSPPADGSISGERIEAFLTVRELTAEARATMEKTLATLSDGNSDQGAATPGQSLRMFKAGAGILPQMMRFISTRAEAQLAADIGLGEYSYIYAVAYFSWLGKPPEDGPAFQLSGDSVDFGRLDERGVREQRRDSVLRNVNRTTLAMLKNQLVSLDAPEAPDPAWMQALLAEIEAMAVDDRRLPWQDGLPEQLEASLEPYRERLEASYSELCNALEFGISMH